MSADSKWAVITGASSGIGKALAFEFAAGGFNLFLTGRIDDSIDLRRTRGRTPLCFYTVELAGF